MEDWRPLFYTGACASAVYVAISAIGADSFAMAAFIQVVSGIAWSLNVLCWMPVFVAFAQRDALLLIAAGYAVNVAVHPAAGAFASRKSLVLAALFVSSVVLLAACLHRIEQISRVAPSRDDVRHGESSDADLGEAFSRTRRAIAATFVFSSACGFVMQFDIMRGVEYAQTNVTACMGLAAAMGMMAVLRIGCIRKANLDYVCPISSFSWPGVSTLRAMP